MIRFQNVSLFFGERVLFDQISFTISDGEKLAIAGRNGSGKSTLFKLIQKELKPDQGIIDIQGQNTLGLLKQELPPDQGNSVFEEVRKSLEEAQKMQENYDELEQRLILGEGSDDEILDIVHQMEEIRIRLEFLEIDKLDGKIEKILIGLGFKEEDFNRRLSEFSGGWRMRVELAKLLISKPDTLLLDEPNNHLDIVSLRWLEKYLKEYEGTVILISHDLMFLDNIAKRIIEIDRGKIYDFKGNYSTYKIYRAERKAIELNEYNAQQRIIQHKENLIEKFRYKASKASFAQSLITELGRMDVKDLPEEEQSTIKLRFKPSHQGGNKVLEIQHAGKSFGHKRVLKDVNLFVERGSKISFIGANGNGKSTLVKMICGQLAPSEGTIELGHQIKIGYYAQEHGEVFLENQTALEAVESASIAEMRSMVRKVLGGLGFSGEDVEKKISVLSGGEKARIRLANLIVNEHNLLILDEPTHHLDLPSKERLKEALLHYSGTILLVSHDRDFLKGLADKTILFEDHGIKIFEGDIEYYLEKTESATIYDLKNTQKSQSQDAIVELDYNERKKLQRLSQNLEKEILKLEENILKTEEMMSNSDFFLKPEHESLIKKYNENKLRLEVCTKEWEIAVAKL
ncbi:MAG: ABC-F family ATP-binding cassette domain-containing protein [Saprospiraceae bacterium]|nr:ABC-F family ATP-binding cassette domain-containing protein [Saprospiraceae bacterium]